MRLRPALLCSLSLLLATGAAWAGGSGFNVVVIANQNSSNSLQLANDYCEQRGVPPQNVLLLNHSWSGGSISCSEGELQTNLLTPLFNMLQSRQLTNQIEYVVLSMDLPYEVGATNGENTSTSCLFYGFKPDTNSPVPGYPSCSLPDYSFNSYAFSELPFPQGAPSTATTNSFLAFLLTDTNLAAAESTLQRGVASDSTFPNQTVLLEKTSDTARNVRYIEFDDAIFNTRIHGSYSMVRTNTDTTTFTNLLGMETGLGNFDLATNAFAPGALADSLTSYGGDLLDSRGQTVGLAFLEAGAAGSYGTVIEPCNYTQKFPDPLNYFYQARGFSLAEAYYQSVANPYQGVMVGEPLSAPFARRGVGVWLGPTNNLAVLSGSTNLQFLFTAATNLPLGQVDLFVDGTFFETITNIPPSAGDSLSVAIDGVTNIYGVPANSSVAQVASNLANVLNSASNSTSASATAFGDRIELHALNPNVPAADVTLSATIHNSAANPTTILSPASTTFLDSIATGFHGVLVSNNPAVGDWVQLTVVKTNGNNVTVAVTNSTSGETIGTLLQTLFDDINGTAGLESSDGIYADDFDDESPYGFADFNIYAQSPGWPASAIQVTLTASPDLIAVPTGPSFLQDNLSDLQARNHLYVASGASSLPVSWTLNTTQLPDGYHQLTAVAYEGTSVRTQTRATENVIIQNTGLAATLNTLFGASNTALNATLQFSVTVNTNTVNTIELFSTGGPLGTVTNTSPAYFSVAGTSLGLGLHPFYAIVTAGGIQYRTATTLIRLIGTEPQFSITPTYPPLTLSWTATAGRAYEILSATNVNGPYQTNATLTPSNSTAMWTDTNSPAKAKFYSVQTSY